MNRAPEPGTRKEPLSKETRRWLGLLLLAAGVFVYLTLSDRGGPLSGAATLPERPTDVPLAGWRAAPLVVFVYEEGAGGPLLIETRGEFEAGTGTVSVWLETATERAEFVNFETLYIGERSAAWLGELDAALAEVQTVRAQHRGKLTQGPRDFTCERSLPERQATADETSGEHAWVCELR